MIHRCREVAWLKNSGRRRTSAGSRPGRGSIGSCRRWTRRTAVETVSSRSIAVRAHHHISASRRVGGHVERCTDRAPHRLRPGHTLDGVDHRNEVRDVLVSRRAKVTADHVGLPAGRHLHRRTPLPLRRTTPTRARCHRATRSADWRRDAGAPAAASRRARSAGAAAACRRGGPGLSGGARQRRIARAVFGTTSGRLNGGAWALC